MIDILLEMTLKDFVDITLILGGIVGLLTLIKGVGEYSRQGAQKRAEHFIELRKRFQENSLFKEMCQELDEDPPALANRPFKEKRELLGFFEDIALMANSKLIREHVVHYMFGYYMIRCWESNNFWKNLNRDSKYWALFRHFAEEMKKFENTFVFKVRKYRL